MSEQLDLVMLVDDEYADNYIHRLVLEEAQVAKRLEIIEAADHAIEFLTTPQEDGSLPSPDLILLDINMPRMNGWEFLETLVSRGIAERVSAVVIMLTTSSNPADRARADRLQLVAGIVEKHLDRPQLEALMAEQFPDVKWTGGS